MRNSRRSTPVSAKKGLNESVENEKSQGKKLVQARLPFKILPVKTSSPSGTPSTVTPATGKEIIDGTEKLSTTLDARKRKLSYGVNDVEVVDAVDSKKENAQLVSTIKKQKTTIDADDDDTDVILIDNDSEENHKEDVTSAKKTPKTSAKSKQKNTNNNDGDGSASKSHNTSGVTKTPKTTAKSKQKNADNNSSSSASKSHNTSGGIQIKLPISHGKNKRRKSTRSSTRTSAGANESIVLADESIDSADDIAQQTENLNPKKRQKLEETATENTTKTTEQNVTDIISIESDNEAKECNVEEEEKPSKNVPQENSKNAELADDEIIIPSSTITDVEESSNTNEGIELPKKDITPDRRSTSQVLEDTDNQSIRSDLKERDSSPKLNLLDKEHNSSLVHKKNLTPKQMKLMEQRRKAREEKERKLQEERAQKQREKEERELAKKRERQEKEDIRRKEREEKEEQRRAERDEKERKRLADIEVKNEEKRKRTEAKEEENRKKEDERKRKEQEKEEAELKKKKEIAAFTKFFVPKVPSSRPNRCSETLAFRPFQIKGDMKLAPICRKELSKEARECLDSFMRTDENEERTPTTPCTKEQLYLSELKCGKVTPCKWRRSSNGSRDGDDDDDEDIQVIDDELERAGQAVEETHEPVERMRSKFYKFHENRRPAYHGTWRKKSNIISSRRPFTQDKKFFDYEVDSDLEWEEEEPGESLDGSDEDKEKESEDEDYEVDNEWFVPHGHLSEEEMQNEEELGDGNNDREAQKAKLKILQQEFAQEMKKKTQKIKPRLIGCIWVDENGNQPIECPNIIWNTIHTRSMLCTEPPLVREPDVPEEQKNILNSPSTSGADKAGGDKLKPIVLSEQMFKDLVRLVHGNRHSKVFLIKEFIAYLEANEESIKNGDVRGPLKSVVREKIDEYAEWQVIEEKNKKKKLLCWIVAEEVLQRMGFEQLDFHNNNWQYTLQPKFVNLDENSKQSSTDGKVDVVEVADDAVDKTQGSNKPIIIDLVQSTKSDEPSDQSKHTKVASKKKQKSSKSLSQTNLKETALHTPPTPTAEAAKKRVPLLMSVERGQQFSQPAKNKLISEYLKQRSDAVVAKPMAEEDDTAADDVIICE